MNEGGECVERHRVALLGLTHFSKGSEGKDPVGRVTGSLAFDAQARLIWGAAKAADGNKRMLVRVSSNIGPDGDGFEYTVAQEPVPGETFTAQRVVWGPKLHGKPADLLADIAENTSDVGRAMAFLLEQLDGAMVEVAELKRAALANGHTWRTVERAKKKLPGIGAVKNAGHPDAPWSWTMLPEIPIGTTP